MAQTKETYRIIAKRNLNLHTRFMDHRSGDVTGGLVHVPSGVAVTVPGSVDEHPSFDLLVDEGIITVLKPKVGGKPTPAAEPLAPPPSSIKQQLNAGKDLPESTEGQEEEEEEEEEEEAGSK